jgi:hypothetical protein
VLRDIVWEVRGCPIESSLLASELTGLLTGRFVFDLAFENVVQACAIAHPGDVNVPEDLEVFYIFSLPTCTSE